MPNSVPDHVHTSHGNRYVLVSACRNEGAYIDGLVSTIEAQTLRPVRWIIVDDGSTDDTYARAEAGSRHLPFVEIVTMPGARSRSFASQVFAAQHGYELLKGLNYDLIGFLDADIRVGPDYYQRVAEFFRADDKLGLCGGAVIDQHEGRTDYTRKGSEEFHVPGGVQCFRRQCFEQIGGFVPMEGGGQDTIADVMTMMHGWKVRVFPELQALHLRPEGFTKDHILKRGMSWGRKFYLIGYHPLFYLAQCVRRLGHRPVLVGSFCQLCGFVVAIWRNEKRPVSDEFVEFLRKVQMRRLWETLRMNWLR